MQDTMEYRQALWDITTADGRVRIVEFDTRKVVATIAHKPSREHQLEIARALLGDAPAGFEFRDRWLVVNRPGLIILQRQWVAPHDSGIEVVPDDMAYFKTREDAMIARERGP